VGNTKEFRLLSLFSGYGGLELGLRRAVAGLRTVAYVEVEAFACANLVAKMEAGLLDPAPVWTDIKTFDARAFRERIHIVTAGYPCQPFSSAGKRRGKEDPRYLWPHIERIVRTIRPAWCFFENVEGHLKIGFDDVYRSLRKMGYKVEAGLFSAAEAGAPHRRKRLFVLAHRYDRRCKRITVLQTGQSTIAYCRCDVADGADCGREGLALPIRSRRQNKTPAHLKRKGQELADTECTEPGPGTIKKTQAEIRRIGFAIDRWPARPGQAQYTWEEPRVVDNTHCRRHKQEAGQIRTGRDCVEHTDKRQVKSQLGRAVDANR
jgi:site-specific DNA-cytosine methylase